ELLGRQRDRARDRLAGVGVFLGAFALAVLDVDHLVLGPQLLEFAQDAAVIAGVAVAVVLPFPRDDGGEMRRPLGGDAPLVVRVVRDAEHAYLAVAPRLRAGPFDAEVEVVDLARRVVVHDARRPAGTARVDADHHVAVRHPALRIGDLPV